jgi:hypothetical protein
LPSSIQAKKLNYFENEQEKNVKKNKFPTVQRQKRVKFDQEIETN